MLYSGEACQLHAPVSYCNFLVEDVLIDFNDVIQSLNKRNLLLDTNVRNVRLNIHESNINKRRHAFESLIAAL